MKLSNGLINIDIVDESEARVDFDDSIYISRMDIGRFKEEYNKLLDKYRI